MYIYIVDTNNIPEALTVETFHKICFEYDTYYVYYPPRQVVKASAENLITTTYITISKSSNNIKVTTKFFTFTLNDNNISINDGSGGNFEITSITDTVTEL